MLKIITLFEQDIPVRTYEDSLTRNNETIINLSIIEMGIIACTTEFQGSYTGLFGPNTIRLKVKQHDHSLELDFDGDTIHQYPPNFIEQHIINLITR